MATTESLLTDAQIDEATAQIVVAQQPGIRAALKTARDDLDTELQVADVSDAVILQVGNDWLAWIRGMATTVTDQT